MGECLSSMDASAIDMNTNNLSDVGMDDDHHHFDQFTKDHKNNNRRSVSYCNNDWLKFPICCPYCSNHSEPSSEFQLVILGPGYTGKTTLRHHLVQRYGHAFCKADFLMYRDILQHNVIDLFRDLLQKPGLHYNELKQFITYIHQQSGDEFELLSSEVYHCQTEEKEEEEEDLNPIQIDLGIDDLDCDGTLSDQEKEEEEEQQKMNFKAVNSDCSFSINDTHDANDKLNIFLNDTKYGRHPNHINKIQPFSKPLNMRHELQISVTSIDENSKEYDSDHYGTTYHDKYSSINQSSPTTNSPVGSTNDIDVNYEIFSNHSTAATSVTSEISTHSQSSQTPNTLNPANLFAKLEQYSQSETYIPSQSADSIQSDSSDKYTTKNPPKSIDDQMMIDEQIKCHTQPLNTKKLNKRWFDYFLSSKRNKNNHSNPDLLQQRRKSTLSALFTSFMKNRDDTNNNKESKMSHCDFADNKQRNLQIDDDDIDNDHKYDDEEEGNMNDDTNDDDDELMMMNKENHIMDTFGISSLSELLERLKHEDLKYGRDNGRYLILNSHRILNEDFEPTFIDLLQCHVRSTGLMFENHVMCRSLPIDGYNKDLQCQEKQDIVFKVVDVGGHRNERKKWNYVLSQPNDAIVFVVSAASFCQVLFEDFKMNAMRESLDVWDNIMSNKDNERHDGDDDEDKNDTQFILVINKIDLFYQRYHLFNKYFPEYDGDMNNKYEILDYIKSLYLNIAKKYNKTNIHCVCTKLTDSLEIASFDVEQIKDILMNLEITEKTEYSMNCQDMLNRDIVDIIIDYAIGDVFWSEKWLKPMWENRMKHKMKKNKLSPPNKTNKPKKNKKSKSKQNQRAQLELQVSTSYSSNSSNSDDRDQQILDQQITCDHINHPHDYQRHQKARKRQRSSSNKSRHSSFTRRISQIFQSHY